MDYLTPEINATEYFKTQGTSQPRTQHHVPEDPNPQQHCENHRSVTVINNGNFSESFVHSTIRNNVNQTEMLVTVNS